MSCFYNGRGKSSFFLSFDIIKVDIIFFFANDDYMMSQSQLMNRDCLCIFLSVFPGGG